MSLPLPNVLLETTAATVSTSAAIPWQTISGTGAFSATRIRAVWNMEFIATAEVMPRAISLNETPSLSSAASFLVRVALANFLSIKAATTLRGVASSEVMGVRVAKISNALAKH